MPRFLCDRGTPPHPQPSIRTIRRHRKVARYSQQKFKGNFFFFLNRHLLQATHILVTLGVPAWASTFPTGWRPASPSHERVSGPVFPLPVLAEGPRGCGLGVKSAAARHTRGQEPRRF